MKLDEAIKHLEETLSDKSHKWSCESCKQEHEQLLEWLKELKAYKESPTGDMISREALKEHKVYSEKRREYVVPVYYIDRAPAISPYKAIHDELHKGEEE